LDPPSPRFCYERFSMAHGEALIPCRTDDGLSLSIRHLPAQGSVRRGPVILQHGLGANGIVFDYPNRSFAKHLSERGFDCYITELRGTGRSERCKTPFGIDEYLERDLPALIASVQRHSGQQRLSWVGHSMGGILAMFYVMEHADAPITRFVAVGSALDYRPGHSVYRDMRRMRFLAGNWLPFLPFHALSRLNAQVAGRGPFAFPAEGMNFVRANIEPEIVRKVLTHGFSPIPFRLLDDLDTTFGEHGFCRKRGELKYLEHCERFAVETLLVVGSGDPQCSELAVEETARLLGKGARVQVARFGKPHGQREHYGHFDLLLGKHAREETWPTLTAFLEKD
jgi:pimeloyl-ACP methyl ester carboxylesterase